MAFSPVVTVVIEATAEAKWTKLREDLPHVMLSNLGPSVVYVALGHDAAETTLAGMPVFPMGQLLINKGIGGPGISAVSDELPTTLVVTLGIGG